MAAPEFDVIVIGGGIAGVSAGASLAAARKVLVIEAESQLGFTPVHGRRPTLRPPMAARRCGG